MGIIQRIKGFFQKRSTNSLENPANWLVRFFAGAQSATGLNISEDDMLRVSAVFSCINLISNTIASLPFPVYRRLQPRGKEKARDHYLYDILMYEPNPEMTAFDFRKTMQVQLELYGNAYANIVYDRAGRVKELWPIPSPYVKVVRTDAGELVGYEIAVPGDGVKRVAPQEMFHLRGLGDGYVGFKPLQYAREIIGLALATEQYGAEFFANGAVASGIVEIPGRLSPEALEKFKADFRRKYEGLGRQHRILFLEQGLKFHQMTIQNDNAQFLETRKYQVEEVARFFGVPPHKVGALDRATFSNIEHQAMEFVQDCIRPRVVNWEQQVRRQLFREADKGKYFAEFILGGLLRGDAKTRAEYYRVGRNDGWLSANDIRELENLNPIPPEQGGDDYLINANMVPIRAALQEKGGETDAGN